jgi:hypothetical protein
VGFRPAPGDGESDIKAAEWQARKIASFRELDLSACRLEQLVYICCQHCRLSSCASHGHCGRAGSRCHPQEIMPTQGIVLACFNGGHAGAMHVMLSSLSSEVRLQHPQALGKRTCAGLRGLDCGRSGLHCARCVLLPGHKASTCRQATAATRQRPLTLAGKDKRMIRLLSRAVRGPQPLFLRSNGDE